MIDVQIPVHGNTIGVAYFDDRSCFCIRLRERAAQVEIEGLDHGFPTFTCTAKEPLSDDQKNLFREWAHDRFKLLRFVDDRSFEAVVGRPLFTWVVGAPEGLLRFEAEVDRALRHGPLGLTVEKDWYSSNPAFTNPALMDGEDLDCIEDYSDGWEHNE